MTEILKNKKVGVLFETQCSRKKRTVTRPNLLLSSLTRSVNIYELFNYLPTTTECLIVAGKLFHTRGPATAKLLSPREWYVCVEQRVFCIGR